MRRNQTTAAHRATILRLRREGLSISEIAATTGVDRSVVGIVVKGIAREITRTCWCGVTFLASSADHGGGKLPIYCSRAHAHKAASFARQGRHLVAPLDAVAPRG